MEGIQIGRLGAGELEGPSLTFGGTRRRTFGLCDVPSTQLGGLATRRIRQHRYLSAISRGRASDLSQK